MGRRAAASVVVLVSLWSCSNADTSAQVSPDEQGARRLIRLLHAGEYEVVHQSLSSEFRDEVSRDEVRRVWEDVLSEVGRIESIDAPRRGRDERTVIYEVPIRGEEGSAHADVAFRGDRVAGLILRAGKPDGRFSR